MRNLIDSLKYKNVDNVCKLKKILDQLAASGRKKTKLKNTFRLDVPKILWELKN